MLYAVAFRVRTQFLDFLSFSLFLFLSFCVFSGRIDSQEIMQSLRDLGVHISEQQAEKILKRSVHLLFICKGVLRVPDLYEVSKPVVIYQ